VTSSCGDGKVDAPVEECDDGNTDKGDGCVIDPSASPPVMCKLNVCGDGYWYQGVESCDEGDQNGVIKPAPYNSTSYYCNASCQYMATSGEYCGDGTINGDEICDGNDIKPACFEASTRERQSSCTTADDSCLGIYRCKNTQLGWRCDGGPNDRDDCSQIVRGLTVGNDAICNTDATTPTCRYLGVCNGGVDNGKPCTMSKNSQGGFVPLTSGTDTIGCAGGFACVPPQCAGDCQSSCPFAYKIESIAVKTEEVGSQPGASVDLFSFLNIRGQTPDNATLFIPACRSINKITADVDKKDVTPPDVDVVFVTDRSGSMGGSNIWRMNSVKQATVEAIENLFSIYSNYPEDTVMRIGLVSFGSSMSHDSDLVGVDRKTILINTVNGYAANLGTTNTHLGINEAVRMLSTSAAETEKIIVVLTDGEPNNTSDMMQSVRNENGSLKFPNIKIFTATLNDSESLFAKMRFVSNDTCQDRYYSGPFSTVADCVPDGAVEYAFQSKQAQGAEGVRAMYQAITNSVVGVSIALTAESGGVAQPFINQVPEGLNQSLKYPDFFRCSNESQSIPLRVEYPGEGKVHLRNFRIEYCPTQ
jgi:cysteine-rich repeat protein